MPRIDFPDALDQKLEAALPEHFSGPRKAGMRVEHVVDAFLRQQSISPTVGRSEVDVTVGRGLQAPAAPPEGPARRTA